MAKNKGYISVWRDIQDNDLWTSEPFSKGQAWIDLLLMANHTEKTIVMGNEVVKAEVGSVITSELKLMNRWSWGKEKLRNFLKLLEKLEMIERRPDHKKTYILITNYAKYQTTTQTAPNIENIRFEEESQTTTQTENRPTADHEQTMNRPQTITKNNYEITKDNRMNDREKENIYHNYGKYGNVILSDEEYEVLQSYSVYQSKIDRRSIYKNDNPGRNFSSDFEVIKKWCIEDEKKRGEEDVSEDRGKVFDVEDFL